MVRFRGAPFLAVILFLVGGCSSALNSPSSPVTLSDLSLAQKQQYISKAMATLKIFRGTALDLPNRKQTLSRQEMGDEVQRYVKLQVDPILADAEAGAQPQTRLEVAKLQLLCAQVYLDLGKYMESWQCLRAMERRYSNQPDLLSAAIDPREYGFDNLGDGIRDLKKILSSKAFRS
jgi:hypothetical protein